MTAMVPWHQARMPPAEDDHRPLTPMVLVTPSVQAICSLTLLYMHRNQLTVENIPRALPASLPSQRPNGLHFEGVREYGESYRGTEQELLNSHLAEASIVQFQPAHQHVTHHPHVGGLFGEISLKTLRLCVFRVVSDPCSETFGEGTRKLMSDTTHGAPRFTTR